MKYLNGRPKFVDYSNFDITNMNFGATGSNFLCKIGLYRTTSGSKVHIDYIKVDIANQP